MSASMRWGRAAPWLAAAGVLLTVTTEVLRVPGVFGPNEDGLVFAVPLWLAIVSWGGVGALIGLRRPDNAIGLVLSGEAALIGAAILLDELGRTSGGDLSAVLASVSDWILIPILLAVPLLLVLFPSGRPPTRRWNAALWLLLASLVTGIVGFHLDPVGQNAVRSLLMSASAFAGFAGAALAIASIVVRFRRSSGDERAQLRWLAYAAALGGVLLLSMFAALPFAGPDEESLATTLLSFALLMLMTVGLPLTIGISILRFRLYDIDLVIRKTVVFAILVLLIMAVAIGLYLSVSAVITPLAPDETLAVGWTGLILGLLVWPLYRLARRVADRVVFRGRASPYEVLTEFSGRMSVAYATDDVLPRLAAVLGEGTGAERAVVWLHVGGELRPEAVWPTAAEAPARAPDDAVEVVDQGEPLGALSAEMPANDPMNPTKEKIVRDLAAQAGLVLRNVRLIEELRESRRRIVAAQDERAKKLERNIHDGAQQQLVALQVKQRLARQLVDRDPSKAVELMTQLEGETAQALQDLRDLARGIYPPLLADQGLAAALEAQSRKSPMPVTVDPDGVGRYPQEVESAVYFTVLEALQNVAKYAEASFVQVRLKGANGRLEFSVEDDGRGFDSTVTGYGTGLQGMADRLAALGGDLEIVSAPGSGTAIKGMVPTAEVTR